MTMNILYLSNNKAEKQKLRNIQYPSFETWNPFEDEKLEDILKIIELEEHYNETIRLA